MQVGLSVVPNLVNMQVARQFEHHPPPPASPTRDSSFALANSSQYNTGFELAHSTPPRRVPAQPARIDTSGPARRRRASKSTADSTGKRSALTPDTASSSQPDALGAMLSDKKRNKLGYHRTSVACVHCRRRKIRCLLAPDDPQSRCANCIRLKKECHFYPVDQQPPHEKRSRTGSKAEKSSASSSPGFTSEAPSDLIGDGSTFSPYHPSPANPQSYPLGANGGESSAFSPAGSTAPLFAQTFDFNSQRQPWAQHPDHHNLPPHQIPQSQQQQQHYDRAYLPEGTGREYWHHQQPPTETPISPTGYPYSSITPHDPSAMHDSNNTNNTQHSVYGMSRTAERSMSYSQVENLHHDNEGYHPSGAMMMQHGPPRRATATSDMPPPSLRNSGASSTGSVADVSPIMYPGVATIPPSQASSLPYGGWAPPAGMMHLSQGMLSEDQDARGGYEEDEHPTMPYSRASH